MSRTPVKHPVAKAGKPERSEPTKPGNQAAARETVESIVVAFVLAFLFRTFIAEAFVIPTGSMAPTLFGRHKDVECPQCLCHYEVGASAELDDEGNLLKRRITRSVCPNCHFEAPIKNLPVFKGDRILVNKFPYELGEPTRWDVCVFKFPENPERNYIKRLIGLPGETVRINRGDVYTRRKDEAKFEIQRKDDPNKQLALQILVADDTLPPRKLLSKGWPERWAAMRRDGAEGAIAGWSEYPSDGKIDSKARTYQLEATDWRWLRYRHYVPTKLDWSSVEEGLHPAPNPRPQLVSDFYGYNTFDGVRPDSDIFWVGDLTISGEITVTKTDGDQAAVVLELVEGVRQYRCEINLATGVATLSHNDDLNADGPAVTIATAPTPVKGTGTYRFDYANVDDRLCLWINGTLVPFGKSANYTAPVLPDPQDIDLAPVGLAARSATVTFSNLMLKRDIYYRADIDPSNERERGLADPSRDGEHLADFMAPQFREALSHPTEYARLYNLKAGPIEFHELGRDEFFVMGDNSPQSQDSRLWGNTRGAFNRHAVPRNAMIGKAFLIYWPHGLPFLNEGRGYPIVWHTRQDGNVENYPAYTAPFYPQFGRLFARIR